MSKPRTFSDVGELERDIAGTHGSVAGQYQRVDAAITERDVAALRSEGYLIISDLARPELVESIRAASAEHLGKTGRNSLEGFRTQRVYSVLAKTSAPTPLIEHPRVLSLLDELLLPNYLLSMYQAINILPGESAQLLHHDDLFYRIRRPRPAVSVAAIWAIDEFTADNGATVVLPGSHCWDDRRPSGDDKPISATMAAGSVLLLLGTTWHGGGANRSIAPRLAITAQYCEPWARTQENMFLAVPRQTARTSSPIVQSLLGYSVHAPFMGNVDGLSPLRCLE